MRVAGSTPPSDLMLRALVAALKTGIQVGPRRIWQPKRGRHFSGSRSSGKSRSGCFSFRDLAIGTSRCSIHVAARLMRESPQHRGLRGRHVTWRSPPRVRFAATPAAPSPRCRDETHLLQEHGGAAACPEVRGDGACSSRPTASWCGIVGNDRGHFAVKSLPGAPRGDPLRQPTARRECSPRQID